MLPFASLADQFTGDLLDRGLGREHLANLLSNTVEDPLAKLLQLGLEPVGERGDLSQLGPDLASNLFAFLEPHGGRVSGRLRHQLR